MNIRLIQANTTDCFSLYDAYIQSYIIITFTNSLISFLEIDKACNFSYDDNDDLYGLTKISAIISCEDIDLKKGYDNRQNGGHMENKHNESKDALKNANEPDVNKTAVALTYNPADTAPKIIASGKGYLAEKIIQKAKEAKIPLHKDERLVQSLSKLEIGEMIPPELYDVVAEILVFVDKMDRIKEKVKKHEQ
jgi:flagellar biosynthesis protein